MSDHVLELLGAYLDGELHNGQLRKVEAHLDECQTCQEEYQALQALSATLQEAPLPDFPSPERLAADVALRLPRKPVVPVRRKALELGWWLVPVGLDRNLDIHQHDHPGQQCGDGSQWFRIVR